MGQRAKDGPVGIFDQFQTETPTRGAEWTSTLQRLRSMDGGGGTRQECAGMAEDIGSQPVRSACRLIGLAA